MNNLDCIMTVLATHREARKWSDEAVAHDLLGQLGLDATADAKNAATVVAPGITEAEVVAHEAAAKDAADKAIASRAELNKQVEAEDKAKVDAAAEQAKAAKATRDAAAAEQAKIARAAQTAQAAQAGQAAQGQQTAQVRPARSAPTVPAEATPPVA